MIPKLILQTSRKPYPQYVQDMWAERIDDSWTIDWYDDNKIIEFFKNNPLPEFPNIINVFNSFDYGAHKADLFRYYYLYLNGGFFIDSDMMLNVHMNDIYSSEHDHLLVISDIEINRVCHPEIQSPIIFNGLMGCIPKSKIVYDALVNAYNAKLRLLDKQRLYFVYILYVISEKHKGNYNISYLHEEMDPTTNLISNTINDSGDLIAVHYYANKRIPRAQADDILFFTTFNEAGYNVYGRAWLTTFKALLDKNKNLKARIYCEGFKPDIVHESIEYLDFVETIPHHKDWKLEYSNSTNHMKYTKNMTIRFSHKAFAIAHALQNNNNDFVIWVDGDCIFKDADYSSFASELTDGKLLACQVENIQNTKVKHVESGILVFDSKHKDKQKFVNKYMECYDVKNINSMPNDAYDTHRDIPGIMWQEYGPYDGFITHKTIIEANIDIVDLNVNDAVASPVGFPEGTFLHPELNSRFYHNIGHAGKNNYSQVNVDLGLEKTFEWSDEKTNNLLCKFDN